MRDQYVSRLQVAMHGQMLMREVNGRAHIDEQFEALPHRQTVMFAISVDGLSLDQFHDDVRQARFGNAGIQNARDVRMLECR